MIKLDTTIKSGETPLKAFLARPDGDGPFPGLIVIHEIVGLSDHMRDMTCRLAEEGYAALALDLFSAGNMAICIWKCLSAVNQGDTDHFGVHYLQSGLEYLTAQDYIDKEKLGAIGFCMGGNFAISLACEDKRIKTIAPFYCMTPKQMDVAKLCPIVGSYPQNDLTAGSGTALKEALAKTSVPHDIEVYPGAMHCFMNDKIPFLYNETAAKDSWKRTMAFFDQYLLGK